MSRKKEDKIKIIENNMDYTLSTYIKGDKEVVKSIAKKFKSTCKEDLEFVYETKIGCMDVEEFFALMEEYPQLKIMSFLVSKADCWERLVYTVYSACGDSGITCAQLAGSCEADFNNYYEDVFENINRIISILDPHNGDEYEVKINYSNKFVAEWNDNNWNVQKQEQVDNDLK